jgi:hypothetical protein
MFLLKHASVFGGRVPRLNDWWLNCLVGGYHWIQTCLRLFPCKRILFGCKHGHIILSLWDLMLSFNCVVEFLAGLLELLLCSRWWNCAWGPNRHLVQLINANTCLIFDLDMNRWSWLVWLGLRLLLLDCGATIHCVVHGSSLAYVLSVHKGVAAVLLWPSGV